MGCGTSSAKGDAYVLRVAGQQQAARDPNGRAAVGDAEARSRVAPDQPAQDMEWIARTPKSKKNFFAKRTMSVNSIPDLSRSPKSRASLGRKPSAGGHAGNGGRASGERSGSMMQAPRPRGGGGLRAQAARNAAGGVAGGDAARSPDGELPPGTSPRDFDFGEGQEMLLGRGTLGRVFLAQHRATERYYAIKRISRAEIAMRRNMAGVRRERKLLGEVSHPFIVHLYAALQDDRFIYLVLSYAVGGELYTIMEKERRLSEEAAKFYFVELACALRYLHEHQHIAFRDLKPENVLIDSEGHVRLVDFGFAVRIHGGDAAGTELPKDMGCGTSQYMAPELVSGKDSHGFGVDWWALGCVLYEMVVGDSPFGDIGDRSKHEIFMSVMRGKVSFPSRVSKDVRDMIRRLLTPDRRKRARWEHVKAHRWLHGVDWGAVEARRLVPPHRPAYEGPGGRCNFPPRRALDEPPGRRLTEDELEYTDIDLPGESDGSSGGGGGAAAARPVAISRLRSWSSSAAVVNGTRTSSNTRLKRIGSSQRSFHH